MRLTRATLLLLLLDLVGLVGRRTELRGVVARELAQHGSVGVDAVEDAEVIRVRLEVELREEEVDGLAGGGLDVLAAGEVVAVAAQRGKG